MGKRVDVGARIRWRWSSRWEGVARMYVIARLAGVRFSFLAVWTFTAILTGLRRPVLTRLPRTASLTLALKSPVLRCLGRREMIFVKVSLNPRSSNLSASSRTNASKESVVQWTCCDASSSFRRPGVPMSKFGDCCRNVFRSCAGDVVPPSSRSGVIRGEDSVASFSADGAWNANSDNKTECICDASSLVGEMTIAPT